MRDRTLAAIAERKDFQGRASPEDASKGRVSPESAIKNQSVIRAFAILKSFYSPEEWVPASELSRRSFIHEATVNRFMHSLMEVGAVVRNQDGHYRCVLFVMPGAHLNSFVAPRHTNQSSNYRTSHI